jgi:chemotaxis protein CheX
MTHDELVEMIRSAAHEVFETMLGIKLEYGEAYLNHSAPGPSEGVVAMVGLAGRWAGSGTLSCSSTAAQQISGALLMQVFTAVDEDVLDAIGEVTNMVLGNVKTALESSLGPMGLSIPTVIFGRNFTTRGVGSSRWTVVPCKFGEETVEFHLCLAPSRDLGPRDSDARDRLAAVLQILE